MATVPTPVGLTDGFVAHDTALNVGLVACPTFLLGAPMCQIWSTASPSIANATLTGPVALAGEGIDTDAMHDPVTNNSRMVFNTLGWFEIKAYLGYASNTTGVRYLALRDTGTTIIASNVATGGTIAGLTGTAPQNCSICIDYQVTNPGGQYLEIMTLQSSGGALNLSPNQYVTGMSARWIHN